MNNLMRSTILVLLAPLSLAGCQHGSDSSKDKVYDIKGKLVAVDVPGKAVTVDHEAMPGYMAAMTMKFPVADGKLLEGLQAGDEVQGRLRVQDGSPTITELKKR
jgi:protein SCO1/2